MTKMVVDKFGKEIQNPDLEKGYITETIDVIKHPKIPAQEGKSHEEVVKEYPNGGKDLRIVWDELPVEGKPAWEETIIKQVYIEYTPKELEQREKEKHLSQLKQRTVEEQLTELQVALAEVFEVLSGNTNS